MSIAAAVGASTAVSAIDAAGRERSMLIVSIVCCAIAVGTLVWMAARLRRAGAEVRRASRIAERARADAGRALASGEAAALNAIDGATAEPGSGLVLLSRISHQLRTPLQAVLGWCDLIALHPTDAQLVTAGVEVIRRNARMQRRIISSLIDERQDGDLVGARSDDIRGLLSGLRVLVVEDHDDSREFLRSAIGEAGGDVMVAATAQEGLLAIATRTPDIIVSDIGLPGVDGLSFVESVREGGLRDVPALALTGYAREDHERKAIASGFTAQVSKPVNVLELVASLRALDPRVRDPRR